MENLFSYGTLQMEKVQLELFGHPLEGHPDVLEGYRKGTIRITDGSVIDKSGITEHLIIRHTGDKSDVIEGRVFLLTSRELDQADAYETDDYKRVRSVLRSGTEAWVYIASDSQRTE